MALALEFRTTRLIVALAAAALVAGMFFRLWDIASDSLWLDEAYSAFAAGKGFTFLWTIVPRYETHPPFYYSLLRSWTLIFGDGIGGLRSLGAVCGIAAIGGAAFAAREAADYLGLAKLPRLWLILASLSLAAFTPFLIEMTREVRPYPVMMLGYAIAISAVFRTARRVMAGGPIFGGSYAFYLGALLLMLWLHNLGALYAAALGTSFLILCWNRSWSRADWIAFVLGHAAVIILWLPGLMMLADQTPAWMTSTWVKFPSATLWIYVASLYLYPHPSSIVAALLLCALAFWGAPGGIGRRAALGLAVLAFLPVVLSLAISVTITPVFITRTLSAVGIPSAILLSLAICARDRLKPAVAIALIVILVQMIGQDIDLLYRPKQQNWYRVVSWLAPRVGPRDAIYAYPNEGALPMALALRDKKIVIPIVPVPSEVPTLDPGPGGRYQSGSRGVVVLSKNRLEQIAGSRKARAVPTIWLLRLGPWAYDPGDVFVKVLEADGRSIVDRYRARPIDIIGLRRTAIGRPAGLTASTARR